MKHWSPLVAALTSTMAGVGCVASPGFTLDLAGYVEDPGPTSPLLAEPNMVVAFPIDLATPMKVVRRSSAADVLAIQTNVGCTADKEASGRTQEVSARLIGEARLARPARAAAVEGFTMEMPLATTPPDGLERRPGTFCFGWRNRIGAWWWDTTPRAAEVDATLQLARARVRSAFAEVDALAILFDATTLVRRVIVEARPAVETPATAPPACRAFCEARQEHIRRCGARALLDETLDDCLRVQLHEERCPGPPSYGGWAAPCLGADAGTRAGG